VNCGFACRLGYRAPVPSAPMGGHPGAAQTRLPDPVPLHSASRAARPRQRRQGPRTPGPAPPGHRPPPPGRPTQAGTRRPDPARRGQPRAPQSPLVVLHGDPADATWLASAAARRRVDLPALRTRATAAGRSGAAADRPPGHREPSLGLSAHRGRTAPAWHAGLSHRDPFDAVPPRAGPCPAAHDHHLARVPAPAGRRDRRVRPASPSTSSGCGGCTSCSSSNSTPDGSIWPA
jgi:hypothetical protein